MSKLIDFYLGDDTDCEGRYLWQILAQNNGWLEIAHDYIQCLFPLQDLSNFNEDAPILTEEDILAFHLSHVLQKNLLDSFFRFLNFLGLEYKDNEVIKAENYKDGMFEYPNHNWFRISRVLKSMTILGKKEYALTFFKFLEKIHTEEKKVTENTFTYWIKAVE